MSIQLGICSAIQHVLASVTVAHRNGRKRAEYTDDIASLNGDEDMLEQERSFPFATRGCL